jgi:SAM-dependent methyltransferase
MINNWAKEIFFGIDNLSGKFDLNGVFRGKVKNTLSKMFHEKMPKGAALRELSEDKYHQISWETPYYEKEIQNYIKDVDKDSIVIDIGCGDGRFTKLLINQGFKKVVCLDADYRLLESLHNYSVQNGFRENLLIIHADADELPFKKDVFSIALAIGVLYYLNESEPKTLVKINEILVENGILILSEPEIEGMIFRALLFDGLDDAIKIFNSKCFKEGRGETGFKFAVKSKKEQENWIKSANFKIEYYHGITMFHNYLRIMLVRGIVKESDIERNNEKLKDLFDFLHDNGTLNKHIVWKCRKI